MSEPVPSHAQRHLPRKRFGQNFLHDPGTIRRILDAVAARPGDRLVEIGPGQGAITQGLLRAAGSLDAVELDRDLIGPLAERLGGLGELRVHAADALEFDLCELCPEPDDPDRNGLRVVGNLPYNISTPLLFRFIEQARCIRDMHLMLQREVVERIVAAPAHAGGERGTDAPKTYGRLSVMVQTYCAADALFRIGPGAFRPPPKVESAFLRLKPHRPLPHPLDDPALHARIVVAAFAQRRKTLRNALADLVEPAQLEQAGIDPGRRAETLSVADFARLANVASLNEGIRPQTSTHEPE